MWHRMTACGEVVTMECVASGAYLIETRVDGKKVKAWVYGGRAAHALYKKSPERIQSWSKK